ncbi:MAG: hypothetical protein GY757_13350 [bacterium]|nr:hypothetical protein [bacterium]
MPFLKTLTLGGIYLAGDDPTTDKMEGWDPLFSRWPKWSESYIYTLVRENGVAYWSNFSSVYVSLAMELSQRTNLKLTCHSMGAPEYGVGAFPGGEGKTRGTLIIGRMDYKINKYFTGHLVWEHFKPGNFYFEGASNSNWIRFEIMFAI